MRWKVSQGSESTKGNSRGERAHPYAERISKNYFLTLVLPVTGKRGSSRHWPRSRDDIERRGAHF